SVSNEPGTVPGDHRQFAESLRERKSRGGHDSAGHLSGYDLQQSHDICRTEEMKPDHTFRMSNHLSHLVDVEIRSIRRENCGWFSNLGQLGEHRPLDLDILKGRFNNNVRRVETGVIELCLDSR